ncbi:MAG: hypothetical protein ACRC2T_10045 [Thermoguttaceae bacterium]
MKNEQKKISRRALFGAASIGLATMATANQVFAETRHRLTEKRGQEKQASVKQGDNAALAFCNADFYDSEGKFNIEKGKDAILKLCRYHNYPIFDGMRESLWVSDYGTGQFTSLGLACVTFVNHIAGESSYMLSDLFLLPNQMLPEHWHIKPETTQNCAQKDEGWLIRWGRSYVIGEGDANLPTEVVVPKCHMDGNVTVKHCITADPGMFVPLSKVGTRHWQFGGNEGVILSEVANAHDGASVRHSDSKINDFFIKG